MSSPARQLLNLISSSLANIEKSCVARGVSIPDLHAPFHPSTEAFRADPVAAESANIVSAAALQLAAILMPPQLSVFQAVGGHFKATALRSCIESNVTEILREGGPDGMHVNEICAKNGQDPRKIGHFLRICANSHIYREVKPNVFANTRISGTLDTLKPSKEIIADPKKKHDNTSGFTALACHVLDEDFKASAYAWENLADPATAKSSHPEESAFARAIGRKETLWQYFARPENAHIQRRFNIGMQGVRALEPEDASLSAFDWDSLPKGAIVVDVGGGVGTATLPIAQKHPKLKIVVQDLPGVLEDAAQLWSSELPDAVNSGRVVLEAQDFFQPQAKRDVAVFFLKQILHDWSDEYCTKILKNLRVAASPETKLVFMESILPFACHDPSADEKGSTHATGAPEAPPPLLANYGSVNEMVYYVDIAMFLLFNAHERTSSHLEELLRDSGWKLTTIRRREGRSSTFLQAMEAVPIPN